MKIKTCKQNIFFSLSFYLVLTATRTAHSAFEQYKISQTLIKWTTIVEHLSSSNLLCCAEHISTKWGNDRGKCGERKISANVSLYKKLCIKFMCHSYIMDHRMLFHCSMCTVLLFCCMWMDIWCFVSFQISISSATSYRIRSVILHFFFQRNRIGPALAFQVLKIYN